MFSYTDTVCSIRKLSCYLDMPKSCTNVMQASLDGHSSSQGQIPLLQAWPTRQTQAGAQSPSSCSLAQPSQCISVGQNSPSSLEDLTMGWEQPSHSCLATVPEDQARLNDSAKEATALRESRRERWRGTVHGESMAKIKDGREHESEGSERCQERDGDKLAPRRWRVLPGKGERANHGCLTAPSFLWCGRPFR